MGFFGNNKNENKNKEDKKKNKVLEKAQKLARKGQIDKAVAEWEGLLKQKPEDANVYNTIGDLYLKGDQNDKAIEAYCKASEIYASTGFSLKAIAVNKKILKLEPHNLKALTFMARLHQERGMVNNAKECYLAIAEYHIRTGAHDKALEAYQHIVDMDPKNLKVKLGLAELYLKEGMIQGGSKIYGEVIGTLLEESRYDEAERLCKKIEQNLSSPGTIQQYMIQIHLAHDRVDEAYNCLAVLGTQVDQNPELVVLKAEILIRKAQVAEGLAVLQSVDRKAVTEFSLLKIFRILLKAGKLDEALEVLEQVAGRYSEFHRLEELVTLYQQVIQHDADHLEARRKIAELLRKLKRNTEVIQQYKEMGRIYTASGQAQEACNIYEKVLDMAPGDLEVQALLKRVKGEPAGEAASAFGEIKLGAEPVGVGAEEPSEITEDGAYVIDETMEIESFGTQEAKEEAPPAEAVPRVESPAAAEPEVEIVEGDRDTALADNLTEADVYMKYGHMKKAMVHLEKNLEIDPKHVQTHERLLQIFVEQGNTREQVNTLVILAKLYRGQGDAEKFDQALNEVLALDSENQEVQRLVKEGPSGLAPDAVDESPAEVEKFNFEFGEAETQEAPSAAEDTHEIELTGMAGDEESIDEFLDEAHFYLQNGMVDEARVIYEKILSLHPERTDVAGQLDAITGNGKKGPPAQDVGALFTEGAGEAESAALPEVHAEGPSDSSKTAPAEPASAISNEFMNFAEELRQEMDHSVSGILKEHEASLAGAGQAKDFSSELRRELEQSMVTDTHLFGESDVMEIFNEFREGVQRELGDEDHETHYNLGIAYLEMGLIDEAREEFIVASKDRVRWMDCVTMIGLCYVQKGEFQKALAELEKGLAVPGFSEEQYVGLRYEISKICEQLGDKERAVQELCKIRDFDANYRDVRTRLTALGSPCADAGPHPAKVSSQKSKVSYL